MVEKTSPKTEIIWLALGFEGGILLAAVVLGWLLDQPLLHQINANALSVAQGVAATVPLLIAMWWCSRSEFGPLKELMHQVEEQIVPYFEGTSIYALLMISILAGVGEECFFRGVLQLEFSGWIGTPLALLFTSLLFGLAHLITPTYAIVAGVIGAYLGVLTVLSGSLLVPIIAHALYDFVALIFLTGRKRVKAKQDASC